MSARTDDQILRELKTEAAKWVIRTLPERMGGIGVDEVEVRKQLNNEAEHWVQYNFKQRLEGKDGTPSPDFHLHEERPGNVPTVGSAGTDIPGIKDDEC